MSLETNLVNYVNAVAGKFNQLKDEIPLSNTDLDLSGISSDGTGGTAYYLFETSLDSDNWSVKKSVIDSNGDVINTHATLTNNSGQPDANTAWTNRLTLNYA